MRHVLHPVDVVFVTRHQAVELFLIDTDPPLQLSVRFQKVYIRRISHYGFDILKPLLDRIDYAAPELVPAFPARLFFPAAMKDLKQSLKTLGMLGTAI